MRAQDYPVTPAIRFLRECGIRYDCHLYPYEEHGGTAHAAAVLHVEEHAVIKTLVMEDDLHRAMLVLMNGDREVSTKQLARFLGVKRVVPCDPATASRQTGYLVGGTSPFGRRTRLPIYADSGIFALPTIYVNGGKRGFLVSLSPLDLRNVLSLTEVSVAVTSA